MLDMGDGGLIKCRKVRENCGQVVNVVLGNNICKISYDVAE
jgi:hypothetical protein